MGQEPPRPLHTAVRRRHPWRIGRGGPLVTVGALAVLAALAEGCYAPQLALIKSGLDSLRAEVDTMRVRDSVASLAMEQTRRELAEQRDIVLSTRATTGTTAQEMVEQMGRLEGKLEEVLGGLQQAARRPAAPPTGAADPSQLYDQAAQDLTQGRYPMALSGFRDFLRRFPSEELSDNAQYGVGECFYAQSVFDSGLVEYGQVEERYPAGDKVPAALYKMGLCQEKLGKAKVAKNTFEDLVKRFQNSGEAQLARERLGSGRRR